MDYNGKSTDATYSKIRQMILDRQLTTDKKINQNNLAKQLGVSRTPVIKALHMLEVDGLVDNIPQRGFYVHTPTLTEIIELFMLRQSLEMTSAIYVAEFGTEEEFDELEKIFSGFGGEGEIVKEEYAEADIAFHKRIFYLCNNKLMHKLEQSMLIFDRSFMVGLLRPPQVTLKEHRGIMHALRNRDLSQAQELTRLHTEHTKRHLMNMRNTILSLGLDPDALSIFDAVKQ